MKNLGGSHSTDLPTTLTTGDGKTISDPSMVKDEWMKYFKDLLNPAVPHNNDPLNDDHSEYPANANPQPEDVELLNEEFTVEEVEAAVRASKNHKSPGVDGIKPAFLKNEACIKFIHKLFNYCFRLGIVPSAWLEAIIKPIPKANKNSTLPSEYRGISLQSFVAKTLD